MLCCTNNYPTPEELQADLDAWLNYYRALLYIRHCAVLSDIKDWVGMEDFAYEKEAWLRGFLELPGGIPYTTR